LIKKNLIFSLILFVSGQVWAATYYVRQDGTAAWNATTGCGSASAAMDISEHNTNGSFSGSDVIILCHKGGPFGDSDELVVPSSGIAGNPITYRGESNPGSSWHFQGTVTNDKIAINMTGKSYITIEDLKIRYFAYGISATQDSDNLVIKDNQIEFCVFNAIRSNVSGNTCADSDSPSDAACNDDWQILDNSMRCSGINDGDTQVEVESAKDWLIARNHIYCEDTSSYSCAHSANSEPFQSGVDGITLIDANNTIIEYNKIHDHKKEGGCYAPGWELDDSDDGENEIDIKGSRHTTIRYNDIYGGYTAECLVHLHYGHATSDEDFNFYGNWIHDANTCGLLVFGNQNQGDVISGVDVWANIFSNITGSGVRTISGSAYVKDVKLYNNVFYNCGSGSSNSTAVYSNAGGSNYLKNNLFEETAHTKNVFVEVSSSSAWESTHNKAYDSSGTEQVDFGSVTAFSGHDGNATNIEGTATDFKDAANDDFTTTTLVSGIKLGASYDDLLDEDTDWNAVLNGSVYLADPDNFNGGQWPMGAIVFGSAKKVIPKIGLDQPKNLRIKN
jgi:hypothetical protein